MKPLNILNFLKKDKPKKEQKKLTYTGEGVLMDETIRNIKDMSNKYNYVIEITYMPEHNQFQDLFKDKSYKVIRGDCMGGKDYTAVNQGIPYAIVHKNFNNKKENLFLFLPDFNSKEIFLTHFGDAVVNKEPFKTTF